MTEDRADSDRRASHIDKAIQLMAAVAAGDAGIHEIAPPAEIVAGLREQGIDSLEVLIEAVARMARQSSRSKSEAQPLDIRMFDQSTPKELVETISHTAPKVPFILNGETYDPKDIKRFDGKELHFLATPSQNELIAFDDRKTISRFWEVSYVASLLNMPAGRLAPQPLSTLAAGPERYGPFIAWPDCDDGPGAYFYSDSGAEDWGDELHCPPNRGYPRLSQVSRGLFGTSDWNDCISACQGRDVNVIALYEHSNWQGRTYTGWNQSSLDYLGWNDLASGCACW